MKNFALLLLVTLNQVAAVEKPYVYGELQGQLGNQMFEIASISAHAWDHDAVPSFPELRTRKDEGIPLNYEHVFFRCETGQNGSESIPFWEQPWPIQFSYSPIPYAPNIRIRGLFQSEKYFKIYRDRILELFSPSVEDLAYIKVKYQEILDQPLTVGVQVRNFMILKDKSAWGWAAQYGADYFNKAMALFPEDSLFVVSTNDMEYARKKISTVNRNVIFIENEHYWIELYLLSMCKHNIISNSSFGWWSAWLNQNPDKMVVTPKYWIDPSPKVHPGTKEIWPKEWIQIEAQWIKPDKKKKVIK